MTGRNDKCPCGSGKKYKKCCESKQTVTIEEVTTEELERMLQTFYEEYPERKDLQEYLGIANNWKGELKSYYIEEMIEAIVLDEFFFNHRPDIWQGYLEKQKKKVLRPSVLRAIDEWQEPRAFIGEVTDVDDTSMTVSMILTDEVIRLRRESEKPVPVGVHMYCFVLPDGTGNEGQYLAVSSLIFFPKDHKQVFADFVNLFLEHEGQAVQSFMKDKALIFWKMLGEDNYEGGEFTNFEAGVLLSVAEFLQKQQIQSEELVEFIEDFLVEQQPNARKEVAIAAGAIRFGQEKGFYEPLNMTMKEIAEWFDVSPSSMNKYYKELVAYDDQKNM